jgi:hypothetical protein
MFRITRNVKVAAFAAVVALAASASGSAQAATIDHDSVSTIGSDSFKFKNGDVYWHFSAGKFSAHLVGTLQLNDANGSCARMRMEYFHQGASIDTEYGGTVCAPDGKSHEYSVDLNPYSDPDTDLVKVSVQKQTASSGSAFSIVESAYFSPSTAPDKVKITSPGVDFGGWQFSSPLGIPMGAADLYWNRGDGAEITPRLIGDLWLNNVAGLCARMNLRYYTESGMYLTERATSSNCAPDNGAHGMYFDVSPYTSTQVEKVAVQLQSQGSNGSWNLVGSETVTIDE